ncbi:MAG: ABC transporter permease [Microbacteriaceae bacterium]|nr:ABC transporter permease [Microbacteriaceae bacterium]MCL2795111.1 ABC transporter permease [Microbacteriaceae bacterium]
MAASNLGTVVRFEVVRTLTKRRFWVATLFVPVLIGVVFALVTLSSRSTSTAADQQAQAHFAFEYSDASGLVSPAIARAAGGQEQTDVAQGVAAARAGRIAAFFQFPADPSTQPITITAQDVGVFANGKYDAVAQAVLKTSVTERIGDPKLATLAAGGITTRTTTYKDGAPAGGIATVIPPLIYVVLFFIVMALLGQQMLAATLEEKENRVTEMILTTIEARSLIIGKILSLFVVGLVQMLVFALPVVVGYLVFRDQLSFPQLDLAHLTLHPGQMIVGALILAGGFALFTGALVAIGAIMPTAKDAGPISGALIITLVVPVYVSSLIISDPGAPIVQGMTFFPFTAPMTALVRNALGSLGTGEAVIVIVELAVAAAIVLWLAVQLFKRGSIEYTRRVDLRGMFRRRG